MRNTQKTIHAQDIQSIKISLSSPEDILAKSSGERLLNQKQLITELTNQRVEVYFVREFLVQQKILNVIVVNISELDIEELFVIDVVLR